MDEPGFLEPSAQRGLGLQFAIAFTFGLTTLVVFSFWRTRWPQIYAARTMHKHDLPPLSPSLFGWIRSLILIKDEEVLKFAGLDVYVFLMFFRAALSLFWKLFLVSMVFIKPLRWWYNYNEDEDGGHTRYLTESSNLFGDYIWVHVAATYIFTIICIRTMRQYTDEIVSVRQAYLGHQSTITDRTLRISGIPRKLRSDPAIKAYLTALFGVEPESVVLCRKWGRIDNLCSRRVDLIHTLEQLWADYIGGDSEAFTSTAVGYTDEDHVERDSSVQPAHAISEEYGGVRAIAARILPGRKRPQGKVGWLGLKGPTVDLIDYYDRELAALDVAIERERVVANTRPVTSICFVTMKNVTHCQLAAQSILSPTSQVMVSTVAPSPLEIMWRNVYLKPKERTVAIYFTALAVIICSAFLAVPLVYLSRLLDINIIRKHFPRFGGWLVQHQWIAALVTDVFPTYVFSIFTLVVPFFYAWLSRHQGFVGKGDVELSTVGKNFFFVFVNLFLIFTIESTLFSASVDTTEIAKEFAFYILRLSSFYTNLIVLQGIGLTPFRLLQPASLFQFSYIRVSSRTARDLHEIYKPQSANFGLLLPMPLLILIVVLTYSALRPLILFFGLAYFALCYFVYKYQLLYSMVHRVHSNGRLWSIILRRVYLGLGVFHLAMVGVLVLQQAYSYALLILPLTLSLAGFWYSFEKFTEPLLNFVAMEALRQSDVDANSLGTYSPSEEVALFGNDVDDNRGRSDSPPRDGHDDSFLGRAGGFANDPLDLRSANSGLRQGLWRDSNGHHTRTLDETREEGYEYVNKNLVEPLEGPWIATDRNERITVGTEGFERHEISYRSWI